jgi:hypothetical protein
VFGNNLELRMKKKNYGLTRVLNPRPLAWEARTLLTELTPPAVDSIVVYDVFCNTEFWWVIFCAKKIKLWMKMMEFSDEVSLSGFPHSQSMFYTLMVYSSTNGLAIVGVFILFQDFPSCFGVNDDIEHAACSIANSCLRRGYTQVKTEHQYLS